MGLFFNKRKVKPLFVGSYGNDLTRGMYVFHLDINNGEFLKKKFYKSLANPVSMYKRERFIYVCYKNNTGRKTDGGLWQYATMELQFGLAGKATDGGRTYVSCFVNENRTNAYAVDYYNGEVVRIPILKQKVVTVTQRIQHVGHGPNEKYQTQAHPCFIEETPDHQRIFVCDMGTDEVVLYKIGEKGELERDVENSLTLNPGSGPKKMVFSPNGKYAYVLNELSSTVCVYQYDNCHFTFIQEIDTFPKSGFGRANKTGDILINEGGEFLFVTNCGHDSIAAFDIRTDGQLDYIEYVDTDEKPVALEMINDRWLVVAAQVGGTLESFELKKNESKGVLFETHFSYMVGEPVCVIEGRGLY